MARKPRVEYEGAIYHVMSRGDHGEEVYRGEADNEMFMDTLDEACTRTGWLIHSFVLMQNHYHMLLETPEPNLVDGMRWLQGTYTCRFNARHGVKGHLFQGRYKALPVEGTKGYFPVVSDYIHLNPARARLLNTGNPDPKKYRWSSFPLYLDPSRRPEWLLVDRTLDGLGFRDDAAGRVAYGRYIRSRSKEAMSDKGDSADSEWKGVREGWAFGSEEFRERIAECMEHSIAGSKRSSYSGQLVRRHDERHAAELVDRGLEKLGLSRKDLPLLKKGDPRKKALACLIKSNTIVKNEWISHNLQTGTTSNIARMIKEADPELTEFLSKMMK